MVGVENMAGNTPRCMIAARLGMADVVGGLWTLMYRMVTAELEKCRRLGLIWVFFSRQLHSGGGELLCCYDPAAAAAAEFSQPRFFQRG